MPHGIPWRDLPREAFGPWQTAWKRHRRWAADGTWDTVLAQVTAQADSVNGIDAGDPARIRWARATSQCRGCPEGYRFPESPRAVTRSLLTDNTPGIGMAPDAARHLATHYGSLAFDVACLAQRDPVLAQRIHPEAPEIMAQVVYARDHEWAETADDMLRRRTTLTIRGLATDEVRARVGRILRPAGPSAP